MRRVLNRFLLVLLLFILVSTNGNGQVKANDNNDWVDTSTFRESSYLYKYDSLLSDYNVVDTDELSFDVNESAWLNDFITFESNDSYGKEVARLNQNDSFVFEVDVPETGLYEIGLDYYVDRSFSTSPFVSIEINDELQFNESESIRLNVLWESEERDEEDATDRYGNELLPYSVPVEEWYKTYLKDNTLYFNDPYKFVLEEGLNEIRITVQNIDLLLGDMYVSNANELASYATYKSNFSNTSLEVDTLRIEGEDFDLKNNLEIKSMFYKDPGLTPYSYKTNVLNILDGNSMSVGSDQVTYQIEVPETGFYKLSLKYKQDDYIGVANVRNIYIDGEIPFAEFENYVFPSQDKWVNYTLGGEEDYEIYLTSGTHDVSFEVTNDLFRENVIRLQRVMDEVNNIGLVVSTITGNQVNAFRSWDIEKYLPNVSNELALYAEELQEIYDYFNSVNPTRDSIPELSTLLIAKEKLEDLSENPDEIPNKMEELNSGSGSAYQLIGISITTITQQPMDIDAFYVHTDADLPKATANFFVRMWDGIRSFVYSFFDDRYKTSVSNNDEEIEVWVGESSLYVNLMQQMTDDQFTTETGIKVNIRVLSNNQKIILSNANGTSPDVVMGIDSWLLYDYALRGMTVDLTQFDDFDEVSSHYSPNIFTPMIYEDGVYGLPETQGSQIMIYRTDILEYLGLTPPDTWDEVIQMLPILQSYQMNFYHPLGGVSSWKGYMNTAPFIYQYGGEVYGEYAHESSLHDEATKEAIEFMTELFTVYNLPKQTSSFFEHFRSGTMPIGVTDVGTYLQIKYAASELTGQWEIAPIPGNDLNNDGIVERYQPAYGKAGMIIADSDIVEESWEFLSWWNSPETQENYIQTIKMNLGERYMVMPANLTALENSVWSQEIIDTYLSQSEWVRTPAITPGSYIVERELSNIWNKVVIDRVNARVAIDESIIRVERELERKLREFGYIEGDSTESTYVVPRYSNIENWIKGDDDE